MAEPPRPMGQAKMRLPFDGHVLDIDQRELRRGTDPIALEPLVFDLLAYLVSNRDSVVSKDNLLERVWSGRIVSESAVASRIAAVRRAIGDSGEKQKLIRTVARKGFRFIGDVLVDDGAVARTDVPTVRGAEIRSGCRFRERGRCSSLP